MKRPIKFRGIAVDTGEMVYGSLLQEEDVSTIVYYANEDDEEPIFHRVIPETVGQFTGLFDKNGKEIFEADVCMIPDYGRGIAITGKQPMKKQVMEYNNGFHGANFRGIEVIGNIHEHPELITP